MKDALEKAGIASKTKRVVDPPKPSKAWLHELPDEDQRPAHIPFDAPAITKVKDGKQRPR